MKYIFYYTLFFIFNLNNFHKKDLPKKTRKLNTIALGYGLNNKIEQNLGKSKIELKKSKDKEKEIHKENKKKINLEIDTEKLIHNSKIHHKKNEIKVIKKKEIKKLVPKKKQIKEIKKKNPKKSILAEKKYQTTMNNIKNHNQIKNDKNILNFKINDFYKIKKYLKKILKETNKKYYNKFLKLNFELLKIPNYFNNKLNLFLKFFENKKYLEIENKIKEININILKTKNLTKKRKLKEKNQIHLKYNNKYLQITKEFLKIIQEIINENNEIINLYQLKEKNKSNNEKLVKKINENFKNFINFNKNKLILEKQFEKEYHEIVKSEIILKILLLFFVFYNL